MTDTRGIHPVRMPKWGLSMQEGTLTRWNVQLGERIEAGAPLCDIETAKIANEFESPAGGVVARLLVGPDDVVPIGKLIAVLSEAGADEAAIDALVAAEAAAAADSAASIDGPALQHVGTARGRLAYLEAGDRPRPTLVFLHGFGGDHANWMLNQGALAEHFRTVAFDLPGHGASDKFVGDGTAAAIADIVQEAIDALAPDPVHLVAHSFGAAVALQLMGRKPAGYRSATLIAPLGLGFPANSRYIEGFVAAERKRDLKPVMQMLFSDPELLGREMVNAALHALRDDATRTVLARIAGAMPDAETAPAPSVVRSQVIWGDRDQVIPLQPDLAGRLGESLHVIRGPGHMPHIERPAEVNALITRFLGC